MKRILLPVDFSPHTLNTCKYAIEIAKKYDSEIMLFHAYNDNFMISSPSLPDAYEINPYSNSEILEDVKQKADEQIEVLTRELKTMLIDKGVLNINIKTNVTGGDFEFDLNAFCDEYRPDIIIIGSRGKGDSSGVLGVIAKHIINNFEISVMAVPMVANFKGIKNIMFASNLEPTDALLIRQIYEKFEAFNPNIYCVHVSEHSDFLQSEIKFDELKVIFAKEFKAGKFFCDAIEGIDPHDAIHNFTAEYNIDVIAFMPHKTSFFQRIFGQKHPEKELFNTSLPLLSIRN